MKLFQCQHCHARVHFDNSVCVNCGHRLGYRPWHFDMIAVRADGDRWQAASGRSQDGYRFCLNADHDACNWLIAADDPAHLCAACRHNRTVPNLSDAEVAANWRKLELAKRYLFYSLMRWRLPIPDRHHEPDTALVFDFLADTAKPDGTVEPVLTGHADGLITVNAAEADDAERERRRTAMGEPYRTLVGHFRHEVGHYYWDRLVRDRGNLERCRAVFGDESTDYTAALERYYAAGPPADWQSAYISAYATAHPWEDFAETWAHYIHMTDGLETAQAYGMRVGTEPPAKAAAGDEFDFRPYSAASVDALVGAWVPLTVAINSVNRSLGQPDLYPFVLSPPVIEKLRFVHAMICDAPGS